VKYSLRVVLAICAAVLLIAITAVFVSSRSSNIGGPVGPRPETPAEQLRWLTGSRTRVVWCQQTEGELTDALGTAAEAKLLGLDTDDGKGIRVILDSVDSYRKPLLTHDGERVVFSDYPEQKIRVVNWDGTGLRDVATGVAADLWRDPKSKVEWVYLIEGKTDPLDNFNGATMVRVQLDKPEIREVVWTKTRVAADGFSVSRDGTHASGQFPWKMAGVADLTEGTWDRKAKGCWTSLSPDDSYLFWVFDGAHRNVTMYSPDRLMGWKLNINGAEGLDGYEVYHPRWSNRARYLCITGPYIGGKARGNIESGGKTAEVYVGYINERMTAVEHWVKVTDNDLPDFFPDVWVERGGDHLALAPQTGGQPRPDAAEGRLVLKAKLIDRTPIPTPKSILPYKRALVVNTYEVVELHSGEYTGEKLLVAHWAVRKSKVLPVKWRIGDEYDMTIERFDDHPELEGERVKVDVKDKHLPQYYEVGKADPHT
jgi:hypothetical protein